MAGAKYTDTYTKVSAMGEKLKAAGKQGPSNDEQLHVRILLHPRGRNQALQCTYGCNADFCVMKSWDVQFEDGKRGSLDGMNTDPCCCE